MTTKYEGTPYFDAYEEGFIAGAESRQAEVDAAAIVHDDIRAWRNEAVEVNRKLQAAEARIEDCRALNKSLLESERFATNEMHKAEAKLKIAREALVWIKLSEILEDDPKKPSKHGILDSIRMKAREALRKIGETHE